ncbi:very short patch repair endonuclease [Massilia varians]|uniref:very short patch repair endonuclease n=1 Tax=Massilia varians TaxID=457921 RepID=UPI002555D7F6|nr:very short patch repair endonuclease [Massilia varians]MDK6080340.1 very short patch repair endonuclease [Massilia varians]
MKSVQYHNVAASTRRRMQAVRRKDTAPELSVRRILYAMGYRYRLHRKDLPGVPDIALGKAKRIIFIHGCFWHGHPECRRAKLPANNFETWRMKIDRNRARDSRNIDALHLLGWHVLVLWECELIDEPSIRARLATFLAAA